MVCTNVNDLNKFGGRKTAVALGTFDALHKGHIRVISAMVEYARANNLLAVVQLLNTPNNQKINSHEKKCAILREMGVDVVLDEAFTPEFRAIKYDEFVSEYIGKRYNAAAVFTGDNYRFGHNAEGDTQKLTELCQKLGIAVFVKECLVLDKVVSSTEIRKYIFLGEMEKTTEYMGRPFSMHGEVVHGKALGRKLGFPTANMEIEPGYVVPKNGVYATKISWDDGKSYLAITNVGAKPTVGDEKQSVESYLFDFDGNLYGRFIEVEFFTRLRDITEFKSLEELSKQLTEDKRKALEFFEKEKAKV